MTAPVRPRPHRRAVRQLLLGLVPLLVVEGVVAGILAVRLADAQAPLAAATSSGTATVTATGRAPDGRGVALTLDSRSGVLVLGRPEQIPVGARLGVQFDPADPPPRTAFYAPGDAAHHRVQDLLFGLAVLAVVFLATTLPTVTRLLSRPRLRGRTPTPVGAGRVVVRQGLVVRSWLELATSGGVRWLPVYWAPELATLSPGTTIEVRGDPVRGRLVLPVVDGAELWPSGRLRARPPRGDRQVTGPAAETTGVGWLRQLRVDSLPLVAAPVLGLLWSYIDGSGVGGFVVATLVLAGVLLWSTELLGSDPAPPDRR